MAGHGPRRTDRPVALVTGFEPFAGLPTNPSETVVGELDGSEVAGLAVVARRLPVSRARAPGLLSALIAEWRPAVVVSLGLAAGAAAVRVETVALNALDFAVADNDGDRPTGGVPIDDGPPARRATLDGAAVVAAIEAEGVPARLSFHAGGHLCNLALYTALAEAARLDPVPACGFLHLPHLPEEVVALRASGRLAGSAEMPSLSLDAAVRAVRAGLRTAAGPRVPSP